MTERRVHVAAGQNAESTSQPHKSQLERLLDVLRQWKELIAILTFFGFGAFYVVTYFVTQDQLRDTRCRLKAHIKLVESETKAKFLTDLIEKNSRRLADLEDKQRRNIDLTEAEKNERVRITLENSRNEKELDAQAALNKQAFDDFSNTDRPCVESEHK